ncbi:MAG: sigma-70 family RNA polymerase sigma factor [Candidatus Marinimicrobia bacterium]|nr:sigma-70 family RNA polymerase sigma factor [Candidatus Neomarinimicrobiota bacterium]MCF7828528.1 sigma-70 family RNA polymerase sigma factor [Candidatus Neomarinimicrobiota bacterium]MCF7882049.1 sigma-70 family RNA polymerase sigma factor [Candidatus Neomarinimicrobiota bacterium]
MNELSIEEERELVSRAKEGDKKALAKLVDAYQEPIYHTALKMTKNEEDAEDVLQETFLTMVEKLYQFRADARLYTWLYRIAVNNVYKRTRTTQKHEAMDIDDPDVQQIHGQNLSEWPETGELLGEREWIRDVLADALNELPEKYRTIFVLRDIQGLSIKETQNILDISESNVKVRLMRARNYLREQLSTSLEEGVHYE